MADHLEGVVLFAEYERFDTFNWTDPTTGTVKPINSLKVLLPQGDGTVTRESITLPPNYRAPSLTAGQAYGFPVTARLNKKRQQISWDARADLMPFPAPAVS